MSGSRFTFWAVIVLAIVVTLALAVPSFAIAPGSKAPNFELPSVTGNGNVKLSDYSGKPTLLVFWASWCPHCMNEAPVVEKIFTDLGPKGINVVGVSADNSIGAAQGVVNKYHLTYPNAFAGNPDGQRVMQAYGVSGIPALFVIDKDGVIKNAWAGEISEAALKDAFAALGVK